MRKCQWLKSTFVHYSDQIKKKINEKQVFFNIKPGEFLLNVSILSYNLYYVEFFYKFFYKMWLSMSLNSILQKYFIILLYCKTFINLW